MGISDHPEALCDFCRIVEGSESDAWVVYEDAEAMAFFPDEPVVEGHVLVVPKRHSVDIWHIDEGGACAVMKALLLLAHAIKSSLRPEGLSLVQSSGDAAGQSVFHLHFHLVPRWAEDRMGEFWPRPSPEISDSRKSQLLATIRSALR
ncbi:MAG: HIT domain-containing protein [Actinobacteria bacterium]|nr:HIT domain-containing protein [Actinomycetota bacterium]